MATSVDSAAETAVDGVDARSNVNEATAQSEAAELKDATDGQKVEDAASIVKQSRKRTKSGCLSMPSIFLEALRTYPRGCLDVSRC